MIRTNFRFEFFYRYISFIFRNFLCVYKTSGIESIGISFIGLESRVRKEENPNESAQ